MHISRITSKGQTTIPSEIRKLLNLHTGDVVTFEIKDHQVLLSKLMPFDNQYHRSLSAMLSEWDSPEDDEAYNDL